MKIFYTTGQKNNGYYLASIEYNNGLDGLNGKGKDEEPAALLVAEELEKMGWKLAFRLEEEIAFNISDAAEYKEFEEDYKKAKKTVRNKGYKLI